MSIIFQSNSKVTMCKIIAKLTWNSIVEIKLIAEQCTSACSRQLVDCSKLKFYHISVLECEDIQQVLLPLTGI